MDFFKSLLGGQPKQAPSSPAPATFNGHPVIAGLPEHNIGALVQELQTKGWAYVQIEDYVAVPKDLTAALVEFFKNPDRDSKKRHSAACNFGYSFVDHKEGIRVLTGNIWYQFNDILPEKFRENLHKVAQAYDDFSLRVSSAIAGSLGLPASDLAVAADMPAAYETGHIGMLDTAYYYNTKTGMPLPSGGGSSVDDVNCVPHYDPGFLSFSFLSTLEGLQLLDPTTNKWVNGPVNTDPSQSRIGVIWAGQAATKVHSSLKPGVHRVVYPTMATTSTPRLTMWYEMCTVEQVNLMNEDKTVISNENNVKTVPNLMGNAGTVEVMPGDTKQAVLLRLERTRGIPMSKVIRLEDLFRAMPEEFGKKGFHG